MDTLDITKPMEMVGDRFTGDVSLVQATSFGIMVKVLDSNSLWLFTSNGKSMTINGVNNPYELRNRKPKMYKHTVKVFVAVMRKNTMFKTISHFNDEGIEKAINAYKRLGYELAGCEYSKVEIEVPPGMKVPN